MIKLLIFLIFMFLGVDDYKAENITQYVDDFYSNVVVDGKVYSNQLNYILIEDKIAFDFDCNNLLTENDLSYIKLIAYYTNDEIQNKNIYYYMAAHELIWEKTQNNDFFWTDKLGKNIDISNFKEEIKSYVDNFLKKPSFDGTIIKDNFYTTIKLEDKNKMLNSYDIVNDSNNIVWKDNNNLYIKILSSKFVDINLIKKIDINTPIYCSCLDIDLNNISLKSISKVQVQANDVYTENINFNFLDTNNSLINNKIEFKITNLDNNNSINNITTNGMFNEVLQKGTYKLEIVNIPENYLISKPIIFEVDENNPYLDVRMINIYVDSCDNILSSQLLYKLSNKKYSFKIQTDFNNNKRFIATYGLSFDDINPKYKITPIKLVMIILISIIILFLLRNNYKR